MGRGATRTLLTWIRAGSLLAAFLCGFRDSAAGPNIWTTTGPTGGSIYALAVDPRTPATLYAGTPRGIFKSTDGGEHWSAIYSDGSINVLAIAPSAPQTIYAGATSLNSSPRILHSIDGGSTWSAASLDSSYSNVSALVVDPVRPSIVYASTFQGLFKSTDGGVTWAWKTGGLTGMASEIFSLAVDPVVPDNLLTGTYQGIFKSTNGGESWSATSLNTPMWVSAIVFDPATPTNLYAATGAGVYRSADGGWTWTKIETDPSDISIGSLVLDPHRPATLYAGVREVGIFKTVDAGASWRKVRSGFDILALAIDPVNPANVYAGATEVGALKSADAGESWSRVGDGMLIRATYALAIDPRDPAVVYAGTYGGVLASDGAGSRWTQTDLTAHVAHVAVHPGDPSTLYARGYGAMWESSDAGATWIGHSIIGQSDVGAFAVSPETPPAIYAACRFQTKPANLHFSVCRSVDGGRSWSEAYLYLSQAYVSVLAIDPNTPNTLYAGTTGRGGGPGIGIIKSTNGGASFSVSLGLSDVEVRALAIDPEVPATVYAGTSAGVFKSTDAGGAWSAVNVGLTDLSVNALAVDPLTPSRVYAGTSGGDVFKSVDGDDHWAPLGAGLPSTPVYDLVIVPTSPPTLYAATDSGVFYLKEAEGNRPPVAVFEPGPVECTRPDGAVVELDGSASSDPDGDPLLFFWSWPGGRAEGVRPTVRFPFGMTTVTLEVRDAEGETNIATTRVYVQDTTPPMLRVALVPAEGVGPTEGTFEAAYSALDLCSTPYVVGLMEMPFLMGVPLNVLYSIKGTDPEVSTITVDYEKRSITMEGRDEALLRAQFAQLIADSGVRVAERQRLRLHLTIGQPRRYTFTFRGGVLVGEKAPSFSLKVSAIDQWGHSVMMSATPVFVRKKLRGGRHYSFDP